MENSSGLGVQHASVKCELSPCLWAPAVLNLIPTKSAVGCSDTLQAWASPERPDSRTNQSYTLHSRTYRIKFAAAVRE